MTNYDKVSVGIQVNSSDLLKHLNVSDGYITIENNDGLLFKSHKGCKPEPLMDDAQQCCECLTVLRGQEILAELSGSPLASVGLDFESNFLYADFQLDPIQALTLVDLVSTNVSIEIL